MKCMNCGANIEGERCSYCGTDAYPTECQRCGQPLDKRWTMCPECGWVLDKTYQKKNKWASILLCLFLGFLGAHKFYEGKNTMGVIYFITAGFLFVGVIVDLITLLFKPVYYTP